MHARLRAKLKTCAQKLKNACKNARNNSKMDAKCLQGVAGAGYVYVSRRARESFFAAALVPRTIRVSGAASPRVRKTISLGRGVAATHAAGGPDVA